MRERRQCTGTGVLALCLLWTVIVCALAQDGPGPVNVARGHPPESYTQSSYYKKRKTAINAANGNTDGIMSPTNCIHTDTWRYDTSRKAYVRDNKPWWEVDLGKIYNIFNFKIWGRTLQQTRLYPFTITVDSQVCVRNVQFQGEVASVNCTRPMFGQTVRITRTSVTFQDYFLNMCEFQIWVCNPGYHGLDCDKDCSPGCTDDGCYMNDGRCIDCAPGFWGDNCQSSCGQCMASTCDVTTGRCTGCQDGWYGDKCEKECLSTQCLDQRCDQQTGTCAACSGNFVGQLCDSCMAGYYGNTCESACSDRTPGCKLCEASGQCTQCQGNLQAPDCTVCSPGYYKSDEGRCTRCSSSCEAQSCDPLTGKCHGCVDGRHGDKCYSTCPQACQKCEQDTGRCTRCDFHRQPPDCVDCLAGYYKQRPTSRYCSPCGWTCLQGTVCDQATGHCPVCPPGKKGNRCDRNCDSRTYGQNCSQTCGHCLSNAVCDTVSGECRACRLGWQPPLCQHECKDGTYGADCASQCGQCQDGAACNKANGQCDACQPGWYRPSCKQPCHDGLFGVDCTQRCGKCQSGIVCNKTNGHCPCPLGKQPPLCDTDCVGDRYGQDCQHDCGHCKDGSPCDVITGHCQRGCEPGWVDPTGVTIHLCQTACPAGLYGERCNETCGHCQRSSVCQHVTGQCPLGCDTGFSGPRCMQVAQDDSITSIVIGIIIAVVVIIVIAGFIVYLVVRKKKGGDKQGAGSMEARDMSHSRDALTDPPDPSIISISSLTLPPAASARQTSSKPQAQVKPTVTVQPVQSSMNNAAIYENVTLSKPSAVSSTSASNKQPPDTPSPQLAAKAGHSAAKWGGEGEVGEAVTDDEADFGNDDVLYNNEQCAYNVQSTRLSLHLLHHTVLEKLRTGQLHDEFQRMPAKRDYPDTNGKRKENYYKNRFNSILPYDYTRVELEQVDGDDASDFINASFIKGNNTDKDYIAAQGPRANTEDDWWRMVWQQRVSHIVMLTNLSEGTKSKCHEYWPAQGATLHTGHMVVTGLEERHRAHYVVREFGLRQDGGKEKRRVKQYHYISWMDHEVPATTPLVDFWRYVSTRAPRTTSAAPLLVHCSAGVGRTGTYIALDIILARTQDDGEIDVYSVVDRLRDDRCHMVQNKNQYAFLHEAVLEAYLGKGTCMHTADFALAFPHQRIDHEFQMLCQMRHSLTTPTFTHATRDENRAKNRNPDALPDDKHLVFLSRHVKGRNQYINAVYMPTFHDARGAITTQLPLPHTLLDIWRLIDGCDVTTVVALGDVEGQEDMCRYWPREGQCMETGMYTVSVQSVTELGQQLDSYEVLMQAQRGERKEVTVLHYRGWKREDKESTSDLLHLMDILEASRTTVASPVLIQCIDGGADSGELIALWTTVSRVNNDDQVDLYLAARLATTVNSAVFSNLDDYRYCYQVVQQSINSHSIYANT